MVSHNVPCRVGRGGPRIWQVAKALGDILGADTGVQPALHLYLRWSLDSKGRVCLPAPFRQVLVAQNTQGAIVCPALGKACLDVFGQELMDAQLKRLDAYDPFFSEMHDDIASQIIAESRPLPVDENGRVRLPEEMIAKANLKGAVLFVGLGQKFEIWNAEDYAAVKAERQARAEAARKAAAGTVS